MAADRTSPQEGTLAQFQSPRRVALYAPVWSPNGRQLAYLAYEGEGYSPTTAVFAIDIVESVSTRVGQSVSPPTWSPEGEELAFASVEGEEVVVYVAKRDGTGRREIWRGAAEYGQAYWSPDGSEILVVADQAYLVSADGSEQRVLAPERPVRHAAWSPDNSSIALRDAFGISIVSRDGTDPRVLVETDGDDPPRVVNSLQPESTAEPPTISPTIVPAEPTATPSQG